MLLIVAGKGDNMTVTTQKKQSKQPDEKAQSHSTGRWVMIIVGVLIIGLLAVGMAQVLGPSQNQGFVSTAVQSNVSTLPTVSANSYPEQASIVDVPVDAADPETQYLGLPTDVTSLTLAETGQAGQPTLVWFHADWRHVCQQIKPEVVTLGQEYVGKVKFVRLNVDDAESRAALHRYGVRATPTFVLFDAAGQVRSNVPGWPGSQALAEAFQQLLAGG
jgi:thioredoxin 1